MALERVRFLHTSDWHLEEPLGGIFEVPSELRDDLMEAPYQAAERVVESAIREAVDFVLLAGDILPIESASPYTLEFVLQQFEKLHEQGIQVYWVGGGEDDPDLWPAQLSLSKNVHTFPVGMVDTYRFDRDGEPIAEIVGQSARRQTKLLASDFSGSNDQITRIALGHGGIDPKLLDSQGVDYWAFGGKHIYERLGRKSANAFYCGSPQGRSPAEVGRFSCNLVELKYGDVEVRRIDVAAVHWYQERLHLSPATELRQLETEVLEQMRQNSLGDETLALWTWDLVRDEPWATPLGPAELQRLMHTWRTDKSRSRQRTVGINLLSGEIPAGEWDEDSILGDFLRVVRDLQQQPEAHRQLETYLPDSSLKEIVLAELKGASPELHQQMWHEVAALGAGLLRGDVSLDPATS
ncbi:MAG: DNA repair exonuclease [Pirellulaceae bacterium]|nr:DNA repair exonuclease [Pirellulaceae bacterium]